MSRSTTTSRASCLRSRPARSQGSVTNVAGVAPGPRVTAAYEVIPELTPVVSAGEGFRSLDAGSLTLCNAPTIKLTGVPELAAAAVHAGLALLAGDELRGRASAPRSPRGASRRRSRRSRRTWPTSSSSRWPRAGSRRRTRARGEGSSGRSSPGRPAWLLASTALSVQTATFNTLVVGSSHYVPNVPAVLWRTDVNAHGELFRISDAPVTGRVGVGYTLLGGPPRERRHHRPDEQRPERARVGSLPVRRGRVRHVQRAGPQVRRTTRSTTSRTGASSRGSSRASGAVHIVAAPPRTALGTLTLYF